MDFEEGPGPIPARKPRDEVTHFLDLSRNGFRLIALGGRGQVLRQIEFLACTENEVNPLDVPDFGRLQLRVTSHDHHKCFWVALHGATDGVAAFRVSVVGDAACVNDHHVWRVVNVNTCEASRGQLPCQCARLAEIELATERVKRCLVSQDHGRKSTIGPQMQLPGRMPC